ncbi:glutathione S-transferase family protein [Ramlibacter sp.]|uniref:glutathione S-transferase family protein n=1 Tax=Ramlibacter sp. TaxID=1917967 RepID=UPI003D147CED
MLTLYHSPISCSQASRLALDFAGAEFREVKVDLKTNEQRTPAYLAINPKGRVPALATDRGVITETPAILLYIAQTHPGAGLAPLDDPYALAKMNEFNAYLCSTVHPGHAHRTRPERWADDAAAQDAMRAKAPSNMASFFAYIEKDLVKGPWVMGEQLTVSDFYVFTISGWLASGGIDVEDFPKVAELRRRMAKDPRAARVLADS